jgi:putative NADH-flavin reductase
MLMLFILKLSFLLYTVFLAQGANIVVIGATGKLGSILVKEALAVGHDVTAIIRDKAKLKQKFRQHEIASMHTIVADTSIVSDENLKTFIHAFTGMCYVAAIKLICHLP